MKKDLTSIVDSRGNPITSISARELRLGYSYHNPMHAPDLKKDYKKIKEFITCKAYIYVQKIKKGLFELSKYLPR